MQKYTHLIFALLLFLLLNQILHYPLYLSVFAFIGAMIPDLDIKVKSLHRRLLHNVWALMIILFVLFKLNFIDNQFAIVFSMGFISHLIIDAATVSGIQPLWPIIKPKIRGPFKTGSLGEYGIMLLMIIIIFFIGGLI